MSADIDLQVKLIYLAGLNSSGTVNCEEVGEIDRCVNRLPQRRELAK